MQQLPVNNCPNCNLAPFQKFQGFTDEWKSYCEDLCFNHLRDYCGSLNRLLDKAQNEGWKQYFIDVTIKRIDFVETLLMQWKKKPTVAAQGQPPTKRARVEVKKEPVDHFTAAVLDGVDPVPTHDLVCTEQLPEEALERFRKKGYTVVS